MMCVPLAINLPSWRSDGFYAKAAVFATPPVSAPGGR